MSPDTPDPARPVRSGEADRTAPPAHATGPASPAADAGPAGTTGPAGPGPAQDPGPHAGDASLAPTAGDAPGSGPVAGDGPPAAHPAPGPVHPLVDGADRRRAWRGAVGTGAALAALGVPLGLLWAAVAPDTPVVKAAAGAVYAEPQPEQPIAADGWFSLLGLGFGVLAALAVWFLLRRRRGPVGLGTAVLGAFAAAVVAWQVGRRVGLGTFDRLLATAPEGQAFTKPADLRAGGIDWLLGVVPVPHGNLLLPAFGAAVTYTLLAGWSRWPSLRPEPVPDAPGLSWASVATPAPPAAPEPPAPGAGEPPRG